MGVTADEHPIKQVDEALCVHLGKCGHNRLADDVAMVDEVNVGLVRELEHVTRALEDRHEGWRLREHLAQLALRALGRGTGFLRFPFGAHASGRLGRDVQESDHNA